MLCVCVFYWLLDFLDYFYQILIADLSFSEFILVPFLEVILMDELPKYTVLSILYLAYSSVWQAFGFHSCINNNKKKY